MIPPDNSRRLGRGLGALLTPTAVPIATTAAELDEGRVQRIPIGQIRANPFQPRQEFRSDELGELMASLKASGLLQPVTVRPVRGRAGAGGPVAYELLAGERRFRAAAELGWAEIPALIRDADDRTALTLALVENLQRSDLNPIEEAEGYARLIRDFSLTQQAVADAVGKDRSTVANTLRLLNLPAPVRAMVRDGQLSLGHARALLALDGERAITTAATEAVARGLTVRDIEALARDSSGTDKRQSRATKASQRLTPHAREVEDRLRRYLQTDVRLSLSARDRGQLSILFYSNEDLERVLELILGRSGDTT